MNHQAPHSTLNGKPADGRFRWSHVTDFNHREGLPTQTGHNKMRLITSPHAGRFPVKVIPVLTVCLKADRLQESLWQHLFIYGCQMERKGGTRGRLQKQRERADKESRREKAKIGVNGRRVAFNNGAGLPSALKPVSLHPSSNFWNSSGVWVNGCWCFHQFGFNYMSHSAVFLLLC